MTCRYTLNNKTIIMNICERFLEPGKEVCYHLDSDRDSYSHRNVVEVLIDEETDKPYFEIGDEQRYFSDYDYLPLDEFIKKVHKGALSRGEIDRDQFVATLLKEMGSIGFVFSEDPEQIFSPLWLEELKDKDLELKMSLINYGGMVVEVFTADLFRSLLDGSAKVVNREKPMKVKKVETIFNKILHYIRNPR